MSVRKYGALFMIGILCLLLIAFSPAPRLGAANADPPPTLSPTESNEGVDGNPAPALEMEVTRDATVALESGSDGVTSITGEIGGDFRYSSMGADGNANYDALYPAVAYSSANPQYLVVWSGSDSVIGEYEIWGQRVNAATGVQIGADMTISSTGPADDPDFDANNPDVAYNPITNEFLIVWSADNYVDGEYEIYGRRVSALNGALSTWFRISVMGPEGNTSYDALNPAVTYNSHDNEFLVVWEGSHNAGGLTIGEYEIWTRRISATGEWASDQLRMSDMGGSGNANFDAVDADVAYDSLNNQYLIVWSGDDNTGALVDNEFEIYGQRVTATLNGLGDNDFRISDMGSDGNAAFNAHHPAVIYNPVQHQFLVVWYGDNGADGVFDVYGQRLTVTGAGTGSNDFTISNPGIGSNSVYDAYNPDVAYDALNDQYLVVWYDDEMSVGEYEIWGQRYNGTGTSLGIDTRLSAMGPEGNAAYDAFMPALAYSDRKINQYLVVWYGDNTTDGEFEIWGQRFTGAYKVFLPAVLRD